MADVDYIPAFPITPQTEIVAALAAWCERGELAARFVSMDSEHSMMTAAGAAGSHRRARVYRHIQSRLASRVRGALTRSRLARTARAGECLAGLGPL